MSKHAVLIFTKAPAPGVTKTRLTEEKGGIFTPQEAADLYQAMLLDVATIAGQAIKELNQESNDEYHLVISSPTAGDQQKLAELFSQEGINPDLYIIDQGKNFDEHFDNAFTQLFNLGYYSVVAIGGDLPTMPVSHITEAFRRLQHFRHTSGKGGFVQAPCQECGVSLVGYTADTNMDSQGVYYNLDGVPALDAYIAKATDREVPVASLMPVADIDNAQDLAHSISLLRAMAYSNKFQPGILLSSRTLNWIDEIDLIVSTPPNPNHDPREEIDQP